MIIKQSLIGLTRRKPKTIIMLVIFTVVFSISLAALTMIYSSNIASSNILEKIRATVTLDSQEDSSGEGLFTGDIIEQFITVEHVVGYNQCYSDYATPVGFENCKEYAGENPYEQTAQLEEDAEVSDYVVVYGNETTELIDLFRLGNAVLSEGVYPSGENNGCIISQQLAESNQLSVGDTLTLSVGNTEANIEIIGIYQTKAVFTVTSDNIVGSAIFSMSPYNVIYTDLEFAASLFDINIEDLYIDVYVDSPQNVQAVGETIKSMDLDWSVYQLINTTATEYNNEANNIEAMLYISRLLLLFVSVFSVLIILLVTSLWAERSRYEGGIYLALGSTKWYVVLKEFLSYCLMAAPAILISFITSVPLANWILNMSESENNNIYSTFLTGLENNTSVDIIRPDAGTYASFFGVVIIVLLVSCLLPTYSLFKLKPREILSNKK